MQTDPVGYKDGLNWYGYVHNDPVNHADPSGTTCTGSGDKLNCHIDNVVTPNDGPLTKNEKAQISAYNKAYTAAVTDLRAHPDREEAVTVGGKTFEAKASDVAQTLTNRKFTAEVGMKRTAGTSADSTTYLMSKALAGTIGPKSENGQVDREITTVHEGIHRGPGEIGTFPDSRDPATNQNSHGIPYDNAARELLGMPSPY